MDRYFLGPACPTYPTIPLHSFQFISSLGRPKLLTSPFSLILLFHFLSNTPSHGKTGQNFLTWPNWLQLNWSNPNPIRPARFATSTNIE